MAETDLKGPGTLFLYPGGIAPIKFEEVTVLQWPSKLTMNNVSIDNNHIVFRHNERGVGWQIARTELPYVYTEKLVV